MLSPAEIDLLHHLYISASPGQKAAFIEWAAGETGPFKPDKLRSAEEYLRATTRVTACPHCGSTRIVRNGSHNGRQRFLCRECKRTSGYSTGHPMQYSKKPYMEWRKFMRCCNAKKSLRYIVKSCGITMPTAILWRRKYLGSIRQRLREFVQDLEAHGRFSKGTDVNALKRFIEETLDKDLKVRYVRHRKLPFPLTYPEPSIFRP